MKARVWAVPATAFALNGITQGIRHLMNAFVPADGHVTVSEEAAAATRPRVAAPAAGRGGSSGTRDGQGALHTRARLRLPTSGEETMRNAERGVEDDVEEM